MNSVKKVLISVISIFMQKGVRQLVSLPLLDNKVTSPQASLFFRPGKHQKSPSVIPVDLGEAHHTETHHTEAPVENTAVADTSHEPIKHSPESLDSTPIHDVTTVARATA